MIPQKKTFTSPSTQPLQPNLSPGNKHPLTSSLCNTNEDTQYPHKRPMAITQQPPHFNFSPPQTASPSTHPAFTWGQPNQNIQTPFQQQTQSAPSLEQRQIGWAAPSSLKDQHFAIDLESSSEHPDSHDVQYRKTLEIYIKELKDKKSAHLTIGDVRIGNESSYIPINDEHLSRVLQELPALEKISLNRNQITGSFLQLISIEKCNKLYSITITDCHNIQDTSIEQGLKSLKNLKEIHLENLRISGQCFNITPQLHQAPLKLESLKIIKCPELNERNLFQLEKLAPKLFTLHITHCPNVRGEFLHEINQSNTKPFSWPLQSVTLSHEPIIDDAIIALLKLSDKVESLDLRETDVTGGAFEAIYDLYSNKDKTDGLPTKKLQLEKSALMNKGLEHAFRLMRSLEVLSIGQTAIDEQAFTRLSMDRILLDRLTTLRINGCTNLSTKGFKRLLTLTSEVKQLNASDTPLTVDAFAAAKEMKKLSSITKLKLTNMDLNETDILAIGSLIQTTTGSSSNSSSSTTSGGTSSYFSGYGTPAPSTTTSSTYQKQMIVDEDLFNEPLREKFSKMGITLVKAKSQDEG